MIQPVAVNAVRPQNATTIGMNAGRSAVARIPASRLAAFSESLRPLTILISQLNRGGLQPWMQQQFRPDIVLSVLSGDDVARAVHTCAAQGARYGWPVVCIVMGASHAYARIEVAARKVYGANLHVIVVEGRL